MIHRIHPRRLQAVSLVLLSLVPVGGQPFVDGSAEAVRRPDGDIVLALRVEAATNAPVVAHLIEPGGDQQTVAMASQGDGVHTSSTIHPSVDYVVVFEVVDVGGAQSEPRRLTALGVDPTVLTGFTADEGDDAAPPGWGWLAIGMSAAALALVALWAVMPKQRAEGRHSEV